MNTKNRAFKHSNILLLLPILLLFCSENSPMMSSAQRTAAVRSSAALRRTPYQFSTPRGQYLPYTAQPTRSFVSSPARLTTPRTTSPFTENLYQWHREPLKQKIEQQAFEQEFDNFKRTMKNMSLYMRSIRFSTIALVGLTGLGIYDLYLIAKQFNNAKKQNDEIRARLDENDKIIEAQQKEVARRIQELEKAKKV